MASIVPSSSAASSAIASSGARSGGSTRVDESYGSASDGATRPRLGGRLPREPAVATRPSVVEREVVRRHVAGHPQALRRARHGSGPGTRRPTDARGAGAAGRRAAPPRLTWRRTATARETALTSAAADAPAQPQDGRRQPLVRLGAGRERRLVGVDHDGQPQGDRPRSAPHAAGPDRWSAPGSSLKPTTPAAASEAERRQRRRPPDPTVTAP